MGEDLAPVPATHAGISGSGHPETDFRNPVESSEAQKERGGANNPGGNYCFGCGEENPNGLHLTFEVRDEAGVITATSLLTMTRLHEGPPGHIHGGLIATLLDEAMSKLNRPLAIIAMTRSLSVDYLRPAPLHVPLRLIARHLSRSGRKVLHSAELQKEDGSVLARAEGLFVVVDPKALTFK